VADVTEGVRQALETAAVVADGEVALLQVVEILQRVDGALRRVVEEEAADDVPGGERRHTALEHHVADGLGHGEVNRGYDAMIDLSPGGVKLPGVCRRELQEE
jgi:hypothetical protein